MNNILTGCNCANELIFRFAREAMSLYAGDIHSLLEVRTINCSLIYVRICNKIQSLNELFANIFSIYVYSRLLYELSQPGLKVI